MSVVAAARGTGRRNTRVPVASVAAAGLVLCALLAAFGWLLVRSGVDARRDLQDRFRARGELTARFVESYIDELAGQERRQAAANLSAATVRGRAFARVVAAFEFPAAVLLDEGGRAIRVWPPAPAVVGRDLGAAYDHLAVAVHGRVGVSRVVPSAGRGEPVVALAAPFRTPHGRRVLSGAFAAADTPLHAYLRNAIPISGQRILIVDDTGAVVAHSHVGRAAPGDVRARSALHAASLRAGAGTYATGGETHYFTATDVDGAPWRVVATVPTASLYSPLRGVQQVPWLVFACFVVVAGFAWWLLWRLVRSRAKLDVVSRVDSLTGLYNRRHLGEQLRALASGARRHRRHLALLIVDIDHFKRVNDTHGHTAGDAVLRAVAQRLESALREEDVVGRWGGEEFLAILPATTLSGARIAAERLRAGAAQPTPVDGSTSVTPTVSVGCAAGVDDPPDVLIAQADAALYEAKRAGRDRVVTAPASRAEMGAGGRTGGTVV